jgi:hypothetical protein
MIEHEKIPELDEQQREQLRQVSDHLLATVDLPVISPIARFRDVAVRGLLRVNIVAVCLSLAVITTTAKSAIENTVIIASGNEKITPTPTLTQTPTIIIPSPVPTTTPPRLSPSLDYNRFVPDNPL